MYDVTVTEPEIFLERPGGAGRDPPLLDAFVGDLLLSFVIP
jgi:hypothetical protein